LAYKEIEHTIWEIICIDVTIDECQRMLILRVEKGEETKASQTVFPG
jgi:hypothetical protein